MSLQRLLRDHGFGSSPLSTKSVAIRRGLEHSTELAVGWTGEKEWRRRNNVVSFRFTSPDYRSAFVDEANRLLPAGSWFKVGQRDDDPAVRRR